jgi:hypothetical protein
MAQSVREITALLGRFGKPEGEFSVPWIAGTTVRSPSSVKTDKFISFLLFHWRGRIAIANANIAALTVDSLGELLQEIRILGTHSQFAAQTPIKTRGSLVRALNGIYRIAYVPRDIQVPAWTGVVGNFDLDVFTLLPVFPMPIPLNLVPLYSLKGPDWAGNLYVEVDCGDATALGGIVANTTFSAYGAAGGNPTLSVSVIRPSLTVDLMNRIAPAIPFKSYKLLDNVVTGATFAGQKIADLNTGKRLSSVHTRSGVLFAALTAGQRAYAALSDAVVTRIYPSLDGKAPTTPAFGSEISEWDSWLGAAVLPVGFNTWNYQRESANPDSAFPAETLTSARRFELDGDVTAAAGQGAELMQDEILGTPSIAAA